MAVITKEENNGFRFIKAMNHCGKRVLHKIFCWGTPDKSFNTNLKNYLDNLDDKSSANYPKLTSSQRKFNKTQKKMINLSSDGKEFDVSLLCLSIKLACEKVAPVGDPTWFAQSTEMEYYITAINLMRNDAAHGQLAVPDDNYFENIKRLRELLTGCLESSGKRYGRDEAEVNKEIKQMNEDLDHIMNEILGEEAIIKYCGDDLKQIIIKDSCDTLKKAFQKIIYINPVSFITNDCQLKVDKIFVDIEIRKGRRRGEGKHIDFCDILISVQNTSVSSSVSSATQRQDSSARPQMLLLEGLAGSGKTTLVTMIIQEWIQGSGGNITDLDNFDLLLWVQCRNPTINSYQELLDRLMPDVSTKFGNFLPKIVKLCKVLIIVDGLDELNNHSRALIKSLLYEFKTSTSTTFICTSRPETVEIFSITIPEEFVVVNAELRGISKEHIKEFVRRTHQEVTKHTKSNRNTEELINKVKMFKDHHEHLRLPMNLIFFVYIWDQACDKLSTVALTQTELYHEIHRLCQKKLLERLLKYPKIKDINESSLDHKVHEVMRRIYIISLKNLSREQLAFQEATIEQLISLCSNHDLPYDEVLSAFLSLKPIWTWRGIEERYSAPHKGIQDYWSALHIVMSLKDQLQASALPVSSSPTPAQLTRVLPSTVQPAMAPLIPVSPVSIREILERSVGAAIEDMTKYQNVLVHVAGLLHLLLDEVPETITQEAVQLAHEAKERNRLEGLSRRINITHWYNLLENTKYNNDIARVIAGFINSGRPFTVNENYVESCMALLPHLRPSEVGIFFTSDGTGLIELLDVLARYNHRCTHLDLKHHYLHDVTTTTSDDILQHVQPRSHLVAFRGHLSAESLSLLPPSLESLCLAVNNEDHARRLLPLLNATLTSNFSKVTRLDLRIPAGLSSAALMPLPKIPTVELCLSGLSDADVSQACEVVQELQPSGGYSDINCKPSSLTEVGCQDLIHGLVKHSVRLGRITILTNVVITNDQKDQLTSLAGTALKCFLLLICPEQSGVTYQDLKTCL